MLHPLLGGAAVSSHNATPKEVGFDVVIKMTSTSFTTYCVRLLITAFGFFTAVLVSVFFGFEFIAAFGLGAATAGFSVLAGADLAALSATGVGLVFTGTAFAATVMVTIESFGLAIGSMSSLTF